MRGKRMDWPLLLLAGIAGVYLGVTLVVLGLWMAHRAVQPLPQPEAYTPSHTWRYRPYETTHWGEPY